MEPASFDGMPGNVLIVEDDPIIALAVAGELEAAGHVVLGPAADTASAMALVRQRRPDLALVDIDLGEGGDGVGVAQMLRQAGVPPVFASAECTAARANCETAIAWLAKPYAPEAAVRSLEAITAWLKGQRAACPAELEWFGRLEDRRGPAH